MFGINEIFNVIRLHRFRNAILVTMLLISSILCHAQINLSVFKNYTFYSGKDGLASSFISAIGEDKHGFLWLGTGNGISVYDGNQFTNFKYFQNDSVTTGIGFVEGIFFNKSGEKLWIGTKAGILYTSVDEVNFRKIDHLYPNLNLPPGEKSVLFYDKNENVLWTTNAKTGLLRINLSDIGFEQYSFVNGQQQGKFLLNNITCLTPDPADSSIFWLGTTAGLIRFNRILNKYKVFTYENTPEMAENKIRKTEVSTHQVFLGTWSKGLVIFDKRSKQFHHLFADNTSSHQLILELFKENDTNLWVTTKDGLILYNTHSNTIKTEISHHEAKGVLRGVTFVDSRGIIWYGSGRGLFKFDPQQMQNVFVELEKRSVVQAPLQLRKIILSNGFYYAIGISGSGIYKINPGDYSFEVIPFTYLKTLKGPNKTLRDMVKMEDGNFLVISGNEITIFDPRTQQNKLSPLQIHHPYPSLQAVIRDKNNNYWIGSRAAGLYRLNFKNNTIRNYKAEFNVFGEGTYFWINRLFIDSGNRLWIGKGSSSVMNLKDSSILCLNEEEKQKIKSYQDVFEFCEDHNGRIWMAGGHSGLGFANFEDFKKGVTQQFDGYFSGVYAYNDSMLWATGKNLGIVNLNTMSYKKINLSAGNKELRVTGPIIPGRHGEFLVGCDNGILIFNPEKQIINTELPIPYISEIISDGKTFYNGNNLDLSNLDFKSETKHIAFRISSLGFHQPDQITYKYRFGDGWQDIGNNNEIHLTNLSHGDYQLEIKACNGSGLCNEIPKVYTVSILTPWWATWWAFILYLGFAVFFADRFYRFQLSKRLAIAESKRLMDINQMKSDLYANITHEFRTPLTVILGMADSINSSIQEHQPEVTSHALEMVKRNGKNLLRLVNEMLDLSKLESGKMELQMIQSDVILFVKYLCEGFQSLAQEKQIAFLIYPEIRELLMDFDANKLSAVLSNVLSNAVKFTPTGGNIIVHLKRKVHKENDFLFIKIKDNGPGIPEKDIHHIFDRFYQVGNALSHGREGTGIGLALTKEFIEMMNGKIEVKSRVGEGSEFIIQLPVSHTAIQTKGVQMHLEPDLSILQNGHEALETPANDQAELPLALIIEDNADVAHYLQTCLAGKYQTIHELNGETGVETATEKIPDVIICDVMMPVKDGFAVCSELKSDERTDHIPVILLTARVSTKDRVTGLSCGADAYLTKPFVKAELLTRLDQLVLLRRKMMQKIKNNSFRHFLNVRAENPETRFLQKIIKIIHEEISNHSFGSSLHLSRKMKLSESQIYRKLKAITGKSTAVFIRSVRLQKAKELIQTTDKTISEIAYEVGFNDPSWFNRAFKEEFGYTPGSITR